MLLVSEQFDGFYSSLIMSGILNTITWEKFLTHVLKQEDRFAKGKVKQSKALVVIRDTISHKVQGKPPSQSPRKNKKHP